MNDDLEAAALDLLKEVAKALLSMSPDVPNRNDLDCALAALNCEVNRAWEQSPEGIAKREADEIAEKLWLANLDKKGS